MYYRIIAFLLFSGFAQIVSAQYLEVGLTGGVATYSGDIAVSHLGIKQYQEAYGVFARFNQSPWLSAKMFINKAVLVGADQKVVNNAQPESMRNLNFRTDIIEWGIQYEYNLTGFYILDNKTVSPYLFAGLLGFYYNPQTTFHGQWIDLRPLGTEGQMMHGDNSYHSWNLAIPFGFGMRFGIGERLSLGLEIAARKTFSDYIDDVSGSYPDMEQLYQINPMAARLSYRADEFASQPPTHLVGKMRGNPDSMDWYFVSGISLSIQIGNRSGLEFDPSLKPFVR